MSRMEWATELRLAPMYLRQRTRHSMLGANLHLHYDVQYLSILIELGEHHNGPTLSVIDHLPEVPACGLQGTLGYDERLLLLVALCAQRERASGTVQKCQMQTAIGSVSTMITTRHAITHPTQERTFFFWPIEIIHTTSYRVHKRILCYCSTH